MKEQRLIKAETCIYFCWGPLRHWVEFKLWSFPAPNFDFCLQHTRCFWNQKKSNMNWKDAQLWWHKVPTGFAFVGGVAWFPLVGSLSGDIWYLDLSIPRWTRNIAQQCASFPLVDSLSGQVVRTQTLPLAPASTWTGGSLPPPSSQPPPPSPTGHQPHLSSPSTPEPQMQQTKYFMRSLHSLKRFYSLHPAKIYCKF